MAGIDHSIYFQYKPADLFGAAFDGMKSGIEMKNTMEQRDLAKQERERQAQIDGAYQAGVIQNPDGTYSIDQNKTLQALAGIQGGGKTAYDFNQGMTQQKFAAEKRLADEKQQLWENDYRDRALQSSAADRAESRADRRYQTSLAREEKIQGLQTPYGMANTVDDAKNLKDAHLSKQAFDNKLDQMIKLRTDNKGGALFNREDVARGKQLSKDLLLEYKNMAKLGVLSKSDEDIINAIIPEDPLEYNSPLAAIQGQDPTLSRLKSFKSDSDKNFNHAIATRTRGGLSGRVSELNQAPSATRLDSEAVKWAKQNPNDPRSAAILKANGFGG